MREYFSLQAAVRGEEWSPVGLDRNKQDGSPGGLALVSPPSRPPPRVPGLENGASAEQSNRV